MNPKTLDDGREVIFRFAEKSDAKEILSYRAEAILHAVPISA